MRKFIGVILFWVGWPGLYLLLNNSHRSRVIISVDNEILFVMNWLGENKYSLPGGGIKKNEESINAAIREVYEETGIIINSKNIISINDKIKTRENGISYLLDLYWVKLDNKVETKSHNLEIIKTTWFKWNQKNISHSLSNNTNILIGIWLKSQHLID